MIALEIKDIGGGIVRRLFSSNGITLRVNDKLSAEQIKAWPVANRRALINNGFIEVYPAAPAAAAKATVEPPQAIPERKRKARA